MQKDTYPMSLRLSPQLHKRLEECAARLKLKRHTLAQNAIEAAVEAIERNGYRLSLPMRFWFSTEPKPETGRFPEAQDELTRMEERGPAYTVKRRKPV